MKQALDALELALRCHGVMLLSDPPKDAWKYHGVEADANKAITALRAAIAEADKQEPVAVVSGYYGGQCVILPTDSARIFNSGTAFYTTPPAAQRQPLTEGEVLHLWAGDTPRPVLGKNKVLAFARAIEAAHGIKDGT